MDAHVEECRSEVRVGEAGLRQFHCGERDSAGLHEVHGHRARSQKIRSSVAGFNGVAARIFKVHAVVFVGIVHGRGLLANNFFRNGFVLSHDCWRGRRSDGARSLRHRNLAAGTDGFWFVAGAADGYGADNQHGGKNPCADVAPDVG